MNEEKLKELEAKAKNKAFRKSLKKIMKELDKFGWDDQDKMIRMSASYVSRFALSFQA